MDLNLRKFAKFVDKTFIEGGKKAKTPVLLVSVAAVIKNPWIDRGFVEDLNLNPLLTCLFYHSFYQIYFWNYFIIKKLNTSHSIFMFYTRHTRPHL